MGNYNEKFDLIETKRGQKVFLGYKFIMSKHASTYIKYDHVKEALSKCKTLFDNTRGGIAVTVDLGRVVGKAYCIPITDGNRSQVRMLYRQGKKGRTPIILNGPGKETSLVTMIIVRDERNKGLYRVCAAWYGMRASREPWDHNIQSDEERAESEAFWSTHALSLSAKCIDWERSEATDEAEAV